MRRFGAKYDLVRHYLALIKAVYQGGFLLYIDKAAQAARKNAGGPKKARKPWDTSSR
jgi:hypothetical protein